MKKMALLLATNDWKKNKVYREFILNQSSKACWRINRKYTKEWLDKIPFPIYLYFFHESRIKYCALCLNIDVSENPCPLSEVPPEYHDDKTPYMANIILKSLEDIPEVHISEFPKWNKPNEYFEQGQLGILKVIDIR